MTSVPATRCQPPGLPLGQSNFRNLRQRGLRYVDKTALIADVIDGSAIQLYTGPRRFGKTLALSMLQTFFERPRVEQLGVDKPRVEQHGARPDEEDRLALFAGLAISEPGHAERYREHRQPYPVIALSFRSIKEPDWASCQVALRAVLVREVTRLRSLGDLKGLLSPEQQELDDWLERRAPISCLESALQSLSLWLARESGEPVVILIDEYDTPLHAAHSYGYYDEAILFFRNLLTGGLKDNPSLYRGVLTGILRVAKEGLFSGMSNLQVLTLPDPISASSFGFTEDEVQTLAEEYGVGNRMDDIRAWYNGYRFGGGHVCPVKAIRRLTASAKILEYGNTLRFLPAGALAEWPHPATQHLKRSRMRRRHA